MAELFHFSYIRVDPWSGHVCDHENVCGMRMLLHCCRGCEALITGRQYYLRERSTPPKAGRPGQRMINTVQLTARARDSNGMWKVRHRGRNE